MIPTGRQIRAARSLLGMSRDALSKKSGVPVVTLQKVEAETVTPLVSTIGKLADALVKAGVEFIDEADGKGPGVRLRKPARRKST